jgi:hypothetical protein
MIPNNANPDDWVAAVSSYVRNSFGNSGGFVSVDDVRRVRAATSTRRTSWTVAELEASLPTLLINDGSWKVSASHNPAAAANALSMTAWNSQAPQEPGMWFQIELPQPAMVTEIQFASTGGGRGGGGGGGRGRGAAAAPAGRGGAPQAGGGAANAAAGAAPPAQAAGGRGAGQGAPNLGYPRGYKVETSMNGTSWTLAAEGQGDGATTFITFRPVSARFIRITQTAAADGGPAWSIQQLRILEAPAGAR